MNKIRFILTSLALMGLLATGACKKDEAAKSDDTAAAKPAETDTAAAEEKKEEVAEEKKEEAAAPAGDMTREEVAEKSVAVFTAMAKAATDNKGNCDKIAEEISTILTDSKPLLDAGKTIIDENPENKKWFEENYQEKLMGVMASMMPVMEECKDNEKLKAAMEKMK